MKRHNSLTIAIPAFNEKDSLEQVASLAIAAGKLSAKNLQVLIVDDGSTDNTGRIADNLASQNPCIDVVHHKQNLGFSGAIQSCYKHSTKQLVFLLPADGQVNPSDVKIFLAAINTADVVVGYRPINPESIKRRFTSKVFHLIYRTLFGVKLREISTSILWRKSVLNKINITANPRSALIEPEVIYKAWVMGFRFREVPIPYYPRHGGSPKGANPLMILVTFTELFRLWYQLRFRHAKGPN